MLYFGLSWGLGEEGSLRVGGGFTFWWLLWAAVFGREFGYESFEALEMREASRDQCFMRGYWHLVG
jgi:hypothetical protein